MTRSARDAAALRREGLDPARLRAQAPEGARATASRPGTLAHWRLRIFALPGGRAGLKPP